MTEGFISLHFTVDGWGCVPSLGSNYGGGNEVRGEIGLDKITEPEHGFWNWDNLVFSHQNTTFPPENLITFWNALMSEI